MKDTGLGHTRRSTSLTSFLEEIARHHLTPIGLSGVIIRDGGVYRVE